MADVCVRVWCELAFAARGVSMLSDKRRRTTRTIPNLHRF